MRDLTLYQYGIRKKRRSAFPKVPEIMQGTVLGNYRFQELIGVGGFGEVYRAESLEVQREVAIKLYEVRDKEALVAFKSGANSLAQLDHPNIIRLFDFFTTDKYALMVMELLDPDQTLRRCVGDFCEQERIDDFLKIFRDTLSAVRYCHNMKFKDLDGSVKSGIYHGDIKPDNIFLHTGQVKISDFMIPNLEQFIFYNEHRKEEFPRFDTRWYGTPMYMSPEQNNGTVSEQTDIYNIGVTAFELLTGFYPYNSERNYHESICASPAQYCPFSPDWLNRIIVKCIQNNPLRRYAHIAEVERDIMNSLATSQPTSKPEKLNVLVVFANPRGSDPLRLSTEDRVIHESVKLGRYREKINLRVLHAATIHDVRRALLDDDYKVVHFSGHGTGKGLVLENELGTPYAIPPDALAEFLSAYSPPLECVILNACYMQSQGQLLYSLGVPYTIATDGPISDDGATEFTRGFYDAVGAGKDIEFAYKEGCRTIKLTGHASSDTPILLHK